MKSELNFAYELTQLCTYLFPRILTQACRDPHSVSYGCFDRNWWHYKIRDFPSIILQQGGYSVYLISKIFDKEAELKPLVEASIDFWNIRASKHHAFEEYYPWEMGYPPLAFSTLSTIKMLALGLGDKLKIRKSILSACHQLLNRFEPKAANQQIAGLAALSFIKELFPELVTHEQFEQLTKKSLALQNEEGWFIEYDGPDLGYLSVTLDCLWDLYDTTKDTRFLNAAKNALRFIYMCIIYNEKPLGMSQSRNTDYILPYGIVRFLEPKHNLQVQANALICLLFSDITDSQHFIHATDDRYLCHYITHSFVRSLIFLSEKNISKNTFKCSERKTSAPCVFKNAGIYLQHLEKIRLTIALKKGGVFTAYTPNAYCSDYGWIIQQKKYQWVTHWWMDKADYSIESNRIFIHGRCVKIKEIISSPAKHLLLRLISITIGKKLIDHLKRKLILKKAYSSIPFTRVMTASNQCILVEDTIKTNKNINIIRAPRSSKRHVASADSYHPEDTKLFDNIHIQFESLYYDDAWHLKTYYHFNKDQL